MSSFNVSPPRRSNALLETWVKAFEDEGHCIPGAVKVVPQEELDGQDSGLVVMTLANAPATIYFQPTGPDELEWEATLTVMGDDPTIKPHHLASLAGEVMVAGNLCTYLQWRSLEWDRQRGLRGPSPEHDFR